MMLKKKGQFVFSPEVFIPLGDLSWTEVNAN